MLRGGHWRRKDGLEQSMILSDPKITKSELEPVRLDQLNSEASLERVSLTNLDASNLKATNLSLDEATLEKVQFVEARLEKLSLMDTELKICDISAARCNDSSFIRVRITGGRMTGIDLSRSAIKDVVFENCKLNMANFRFAKLVRVQFINCQLSETDFQAAELNKVEFQTSYLEKAEFGQCKLSEVDVRSSQLLDIRGWHSLKGLVIDSTQLVGIAPQLAMELGLIIKE